MLTVVIIKNPFNLQERSIYFPVWQENRTVLDYCNEYTKSIVKLNSQDELVYSLNGKKIVPSVIPKDGDYIALCPVFGKKGVFGAILGAVAMIALSVFAPGWGTAIATSTLGLAGTTATVVGGLITAGIMLVGGLVISALCPIKPDTAKLNDNGTSATTYTWNKMTSGTTQGGALPVTYGTYKTAGTIIFRHVKIIGDDEYLLLLLTGGQGPINNIFDIKINDMPITNYDDVEYAVRLGLNNQEPIEFLEGRAYADQLLNYELDSEGHWCYATTEGNRGTEVEIVLNFPQGLYHLTDEGENEATSVSVEIQGRVHVSSPPVRELGDDQWLSLASYTISECIQQSFSRSYMFGPYAPDRFDVRVRCTGKDGTSYRYVNKIQWALLSHSVVGDFTRPGKVLVGLKIKATNQLSNDVNVTWMQTRETIFVYNPHTQSYEAQLGTNPAWAAYDMIHRGIPIDINAGDITPENVEENLFTGFHVMCDGIPAKYIDYDAFAAWAYRCKPVEETSVPDVEYGGIIGNTSGWGLFFNYIFATCDDLWNALAIPEAVGLGKVVIHGTKISCICDHFSQPVQLFTTGNINEGSFSVEYLALMDRANSIEVSFVNKDKDYQNDVICVYEDEYNREGVIKNPTQLSLDGCVTAEQAIRYANYHLNHNNYQTRTCTFDVDIDALACTIGDQILVQHDLPLWGYGGIIIDYDPDTKKVVLDQQITFDSRNGYHILGRITDATSQDSSTTETLQERVIVGFEDFPTTNTIYMSEAFDCEPQYGDVYAVGKENKVAKPFTILSIERKSDLQATITCIEYEPEAMNQNYVAINKINYSHLTSDIS